MRKILVTASLIALLAIAGFTLTPPALTNSAVVSALPDDLDAYLQQRERAAAAQFRLIPGTAKRILWRRPGEKTEFAVVYLHGFSATRQEIAPAAERIADALAANLFETRLTGHGRAEGAMVNVRAEDWLADAAEAVAIGSRIGERVVVIGTSTGATLALAMAEHPAFAQIDTLVLISPNFAPNDPSARWITRPGGPLLLRSTIGETRSWQPHNELQAKYWSTSYPSEVLIEAMRLVDLANANLPMTIEQPLLTLLSPNDGVVAAQAMFDALQHIRSPRQRIIQYDEVGDPDNHVLAGDILSPENTQSVVDSVVAFVRSGDLGK